MGTSHAARCTPSARLRHLAVALLLVLHLNLSSLLHVKAQTTWVYDSVVTSSSTADIKFGSSVALSPDGNWVAVRANSDTINSLLYAGSVTVFSRGSGGWAQVAILTAATPVADSYFGTSVAMSNSRLIAGAPSESSNTGRIVPFSWSGSAWIRGTEIVGTASSRLGASLATDGTFLCAGAPGISSGRVFVYTLDSSGNWASSMTLTGSTEASASTGSSIALGPGLIASGATYENNFSGAIYVWTISGSTIGTTASRLTTSTAVDGYSVFGDQIAILSSTMIASNCKISTNNVCIFAYASSTWSQSSTLTAPTGVTSFGIRLSSNQNYLLVGASVKAILYSVSGSSILASSPVYLTPPSSVTVTSGYCSHVALSESCAAVAEYNYSPLTQRVFLFNELVPTHSKSHSRSSSRSQSQSQSKSQSQSQSQSQSNSPAPVVRSVAPNRKSKSENLGYKVALWNETAIISVPFCFDISKSCDGGYIILFQKNITSKEWLFNKKVRNPFRSRENKFGYNILVRDDYLFVSVPDSQYIDKNVGIIVVYKWNPTTKTYEKHSIIRYRKTDKVYALGAALSNFGTITAIGMPEYDASTTLTSTGAVHAFKKQNTGKWRQRKTITAPTPQADEHFGQSVSLQSETRIAISNNPTDASLQAVYIFDLVEDAWEWVQTLAGTAKLGFGWSINFFDDLLYISAPNAGSISVYEADAEGEYAFSYAFQSKTSVTGERFGFSFATDGTRFVVGTKPCDDGVACGTKGSAYTFTKNSSNQWTEQFRYALGVADGSDGFGFDVAVSGDTVLVAAPFKAVNTRDGVAYFITK